jgi:Mn2+/Fe2+ NRAMP family transporter
MLTLIKSLDFKKFGPGLLLAATAIGVSHIVQSVQAGGTYGPILILAIIFSHLVKYPFFLTSAKYTANKHKSLLTGYFELHPIFLMLFLVLTFISMFSLQAVVTLITAAVVQNIFHFNITIGQLSSIVLIICAIILFIGRYDFLDKLIKPIILVLFLATVVALIYSLTGQNDPNSFVKKPAFSLFSKTDFLFLIAFIGWMPCPLDCVVWNSLWNKRKQETSNNYYDFKTIKLDFKIGYFTACILAILFLLLGYFIFYKNNTTIESSAVPFIRKFLGIYTSQFGQMAFYIIAIAALLTMFSTTITCLDAYPRVISKSINIFSRSYLGKEINEHNFYNYFLIFTTIGTILVLLFLLTNMREIIMVATLISFVSTAILVIIHHKINLKLSDEFPNVRMSGFEKSYSILCILLILTLCIIMIANLF